MKKSKSYPLKIQQPFKFSLVNINFQVMNQLYAIRYGLDQFSLKVFPGTLNILSFHGENRRIPYFFLIIFFIYSSVLFTN